MRSQSNLRRVLLLCGACLGTALLAFVPSAAWLDLPLDGEPYTLQTIFMLKQALTVLLLLIVPALWARSGQRFSPLALLVLAALAFGLGCLVTKDAESALFSMLLPTLPGVGLYVLQRLKLNNFRATLYLSVLLLVALFGYVCLPDLLLHGNAYLPFRNVLVIYERILDDTAAQLAAFGAANSVSDVQLLVSQLKLNPESIGVPILFVPAMAAALSNVLFSHLFNVRHEVTLPPLPRFAEWRCERPYVYLACAFALATYLLSFFSIDGMDALSSVAMLFWTMPCALAGLSAVRRVCVRVRKGWIFAIVCAAAALLPTFGMTALAMIGTIASLRKPNMQREDETRL